MKKLSITKKQEESGYTLVELLVVIVVIGILVGIGTRQFNEVQRRAANDVHNANVRILTGVMQMAFIVWGVPDEPLPEGEEAKWDKDKEEWLIDETFQRGWGEWLESWPKVPKRSDAYGNGEGQGTEYVVEISTDGSGLITVSPGLK